MRYVPSVGFPVYCDGEKVLITGKRVEDVAAPSQTEVLVAEDGKEYVKSGPGLVKPFDQADLDEARDVEEDEPTTASEAQAQEADEDEDAEEEA